MTKYLSYLSIGPNLGLKSKTATKNSCTNDGVETFDVLQYLPGRSIKSIDGLLKHNTIYDPLNDLMTKKIICEVHVLMIIKLTE